MDAAREVQLEIVWQLPMKSPGQGFNALFDDGKMYYVDCPTDSLVTIDLATHTILNNVQVKSLGAEPVRCGDTIYGPNDDIFSGYPPILYMFTRAGSLKGELDLSAEYVGWGFDFYSSGKYLYWHTYDGKKFSFVRLDTDTINATGEGKYTAVVETLYPASKGYEVLASPAFIGGKIYLPVNPRGSYEGSGDKTRLLVFDEASGALEEESDLDGWIALGTRDQVIKSGTKGLIYNALVDLATDKIITRGIKVCGLFAPPTIQGNDYYASSSAHGGTDFVSLWRLDLSSLEVKWHYQHRYSLGSQPQVANGIVFVTGPDVTMLFDADTGKLLAKDSCRFAHSPDNPSRTFLTRTFH